MRNSVLFLVLLVFIGCAPTKKSSYTVLQSGDEKIIMGYLTRQLIEKDTSFPWFTNNMKYGMADAAAVKSFAEKKNKFSIIVFGGTWCHDTQNLLPIFYRLIDKSNFPDDKITLIGVDKSKQTIKNLHKKYAVVNVPTFIIMNGENKEVGRVVEYGKLGQIDKELGEIVQQKIQ